MIVGLNIICIAKHVINTVGRAIKRVIRYVPDDEVPDTHIALHGSDNTELFGLDGKFYGKI